MPATKPFAWSFSRANAYETCPKRYYEVSVAKNFTDSEGEAMLWGSEVHGALASAVLHKLGLPAIHKSYNETIVPAPLPSSMLDYQGWIDTICEGEKQVYVEQQFALDSGYKPTGWFDNNVWMRAICDLLVVKGDSSHAFDWKTGKLKHDSRQLAITAKCVFAHYPAVTNCKARFIWLKDGTVSYEKYTRDNIDRELAPMLEVVRRMENSMATGNYPPTPSGLCFKHCNVLTCAHHGKRVSRVA